MDGSGTVRGQSWGFAGLFNVGVMGFVALGGLATVLVAMPPVGEAWAAGGARVLAGLATGAALLVAVVLLRRAMRPGRARALVTLVVLVGGFYVYRAVFDPGVEAVEAAAEGGEAFVGGAGERVVPAAVLSVGNFKP